MIMWKLAWKPGAVSECYQRGGAVQVICVNKDYHVFTFDYHFFALLEEWAQLHDSSGSTLIVSDYLC